MGPGRNPKDRFSHNEAPMVSIDLESYHEKTCLTFMRTTKTQINLQIHKSSQSDLSETLLPGALIGSTTVFCVCALWQIFYAFFPFICAFPRISIAHCNY